MQQKPDRIPFIELGREYKTLEQEWLSEVDRIGSQGSFILGKNVSELENEIADYLGTKYSVAVANGTDALVLSLLATDVGSGDEVIVSPFTFFASAEAISLAGATPVFADILPDSFNLDPESIKEKLSERTRAILPVHLFGTAASMGPIMDIARGQGLTVIEDCAQAFGADYKGKKVGSIGNTGCFSFYPTKVLNCYGDGGLVATNSVDIAEHLKGLRNHGTTKPFIHNEVGMNSRLDEIQAALLRIKLRNINTALEARRNIAAHYNEQLADVVKAVPVYETTSSHVYNLYTIRIDNRDQIQQHLVDHGVSVALCYPQPLHLQTVYNKLGCKTGDLPVAEQACREVLSLPIYPDMPVQHIDRVCELIKQALD